MAKKILIILATFFLIAIFYEFYDLNNNHEKINELNNLLADDLKEKEYLSLYEEIKKEVVNVDDESIEDKIGLLKREYRQNEEGLELSIQDLANVKDKNSEVEKEIINLENKLNQKEQEKINTNFPTYNQFPKYPTGCESVALYLLLKYYKVNVKVDDIVNKLVKGARPYKNNNQLIGGNPEIEFIGDPRDSHSYGVYNKPIATVANMYKKGVISKTNFDFDNVISLVSTNHPVLVWATINLANPYISTSWIYPKTGEVIKWIRGEHALVIFKIIDNQVVVSDPYTGTIRKFDKKLFEERYNYLGKRAIYYE